MDRRCILRAAVAMTCAATPMVLTIRPVSASGPDPEDPPSVGLSLAAYPPATAPAPEPAEASPAFDKPFTLGLSYALVSDYVFRGINFSEYDGEGREKPNHQLTVSLDVPLGPDARYGTVGFDAWFEWYAAQHEISGDGANIQEIDYTVRWSYDVEPIASTVTLGVIVYTFPNLDGGGTHNNDRTQEWYVSLEHNDAWLWRWAGYQGDGGVLNPSLSVYHDLHLSRGVWIELGISHDFEIVRNVTLAPSVLFAIDGGYLGPLLKSDDHDFRYAYTQFGIDVAYDMTELLHLPDWAGSVTLSGGLSYTLSTSAVRHNDVIDGDELWGGMTVAWSW